MAGVLVNLKVGEVVRPNTYVKKRYVPPPTNHQDAWFDKHPVAGYHWSSKELAVEEAGGIAKAWLKHRRTSCSSHRYKRSTIPTAMESPTEKSLRIS